MAIGRDTFKNIRRTVRVPVDYEPGPDDTWTPIHDTARLREMSGTERDQFEISAFKDEGGKRVVEPLYLRARLVALCLVDEAGVRVFGDEDIEALSGAYPSAVIGMLFEAAQKLNGLAADAVADSAKNSDSVPAAALPSA